MTGKIIKGIGGFYYVYADGIIYECKARGVFRNKKIKPLVGDNAEIEIISKDPAVGNIISISARHNELIRPAAANVDIAVVIFALSDPKPNFNLLDRFLIMMEQQEINTVIVLNKSDLISQSEAADYKKIYSDSGYETFIVSASENTGIDRLRETIKGKTAIFAGPSGVGKSSILNRIFPQAEAKTGEISEKIKRGKHTTRHTELNFLGEGTYIMDTPGFSSLDVFDISEENLKYYFREFENYNDKCRFNGCVHIDEPDCAVKNALQKGLISSKRYDNYRQIYKEIKNRRKW